MAAPAVVVDSETSTEPKYAFDKPGYGLMGICFGGRTLWESRHGGAEEGNAAIPEHPIVFMKMPSAALDPQAAIQIPTRLASTQVDATLPLLGPFGTPPPLVKVGLGFTAFSGAMASMTEVSISSA